MGTKDYELIESTQRQNHEIRRHEEEMYILCERKILAFLSELKPKFSKDGNMYCFLFGDNLQEGIAGFGESPNEAAMNLYNQFVGRNPASLGARR